MSLKRIISVGATLLILTLAVVLVRSLWLHYMESPGPATVACAPT